MLYNCKIIVICKRKIQVKGYNRCPFHQTVH